MVVRPITSTWTNSTSNTLYTIAFVNSALSFPFLFFFFSSFNDVASQKCAFAVASSFLVFNKGCCVAKLL